MRDGRRFEHDHQRPGCRREPDPRPDPGHTYSECVARLMERRIDAVTTDDAILKGYAAQDPGRLKVVGKPFSTERYSIGLARDDAALRGVVNDALQAAFDDGSWKKIYDATLGRSGSAASPPPLERS